MGGRTNSRHGQTFRKKSIAEKNAAQVLICESTTDYMLMVLSLTLKFPTYMYFVLIFTCKNCIKITHHSRTDATVLT